MPMYQPSSAIRSVQQQPRQRVDRLKTLRTEMDMEPKTQQPAMQTLNTQQPGTLPATPSFGQPRELPTYAPPPKFDVQGGWVPPTSDKKDDINQAKIDAANAPPTDEERIQDWLAGVLGGDGGPDTAAEEAQLRAEYETNLGDDLYEQNARAGAGGWGSSGMLAGLQADARADSTQRLGRDLVDLERDAREEEFQRMLDAIGVSQDERGLALEQFLTEQQLEMLQAWLDGEDGSSGGGSSRGNPGSSGGGGSNSSSSNRPHTSSSSGGGSTVAGMSKEERERAYAEAERKREIERRRNGGNN